MDIQYPFIASNRDFNVPQVDKDYQSITKDGSLIYLECIPPYLPTNAVLYMTWLKILIGSMTKDRVMIFIHGYDNPWSKVTDINTGLAAMLTHFTNAPTYVTTPYPGPIILFDWPSFFKIDGAHPCGSFDSAKSNATTTANLSFGQLKKIVDDIQRIKPGTKIDIVCHSMGNFVLQQSLKTSAGSFSPGSISTFLLNAAAISNDSFVPGSTKSPATSLPQYLTPKGSIQVLWSSNDDALPDGELCDRWKELGYRGPAPGSTSIINNDLSSIVIKPAQGGAPNVHTSYYYIKKALDLMISMMIK